MMCCQPPPRARVCASSNGSKGEPTCQHSSQVSPSRPFFWANRSGMFLDRFCANLLCISANVSFQPFFSKVATMWLSQQRAKKRAHPAGTPEGMRPTVGRRADMALKPQKKTSSSASLAPRARTRLSAQLRSDTTFGCRRTRKPTVKLQRGGALHLLGTARPLRPVDAEACGLRANHLTIHVQSVIAFPGCVAVSQGFF